MDESQTLSAPIFSNDSTARGPVKSCVIATSIFAIIISPASTLSLLDALKSFFANSDNKVKERNDNSNNSYAKYTYEKSSKKFPLEEDFTKQNLFKNESEVAENDPNEKKEKYSKISKVESLPPSKIEKGSGIDTSIMIEKHLNKDKNLENSKFTEIQLELNKPTNRENQESEIIDINSNKINIPNKFQEKSTNSLLNNKNIRDNYDGEQFKKYKIKPDNNNSYKIKNNNNDPPNNNFFNANYISGDFIKNNPNDGGDSQYSKMFINDGFTEEKLNHKGNNMNANNSNLLNGGNCFINKNQNNLNHNKGNNFNSKNNLNMRQNNFNLQNNNILNTNNNDNMMNNNKNNGNNNFRIKNNNDNMMNNINNNGNNNFWIKNNNDNMMNNINNNKNNNFWIKNNNDNMMNNINNNGNNNFRIMNNNDNMMNNNNNNGNNNFRIRNNNSYNWSIYSIDMNNNKDNIKIMNVKKSDNNGQNLYGNQNNLFNIPNFIIRENSINNSNNINNNIGKKKKDNLFRAKQENYLNNNNRYDEHKRRLNMNENVSGNKKGSDILTNLIISSK